MRQYSQTTIGADQAGLFAAIGRTPPAPLGARVRRRPPRLSWSARVLPVFALALAALVVGAGPAAGQAPPVSTEDLTTVTGLGA